MSLPAKTMDERKLTAWLIMEGYLTPSQVKQALEEQLRLKRDGTEIDIIEVARREKIISDVQVLEVLEKTGYKPPKPAGAGSSAERPSLQDPAAAAKVATPKKPSSDSGWGKAAVGAPEASDDRIDSVPMIPAQYAESVAEIPSEYAVYARGAAGSEATSEPSVSDLSSVAGSETPSAEIPAVASDEATPLAGGAPPSTKRSSGTHRAGRTSGAQGSAPSLTAAARRRSNDSTKNLLVAGAFLIPIIIALLFMGPRRGTTDDVSKVDTPTKRVQTNNDFQAVVADLNASLDRMESAPGKAGRDAEVKRLKGVIARLKAAKLVVSERRLVDKAEDRLKRLTGEARIGGGDDIPLPPPLSPEELKVRAESAWANLARNFERILWLSIQQPRGELQLGAESIRNVDLKKKVTKAIPSYSAKGPDGIAALVGAPELHPILGVGGYSALLREASRFPDELRGTDRWKRWGKAIIPQFEKLQGLAEAYRDAMRAAEEHSDVGDLQAALACFEHPKHRNDTWFVAVRKYLALPAVVKEFEERKKAAAAGTPITRRRRLPGSRNGGTTSNWRRNWEERFLHLAKQHQRAKTDDEKASLAGDLDKILTETLDMARSSWESCKRIVAFYDKPKHAKVFKRAPQLKPNLKAHHELYFKGAFTRASGPESFRSLDRWCKLHGYEAWRAQIAPYLRLVAAANNRAARAREGVRQRRAGAKAAVAKFDRTRLKNVREGLVQVVEWMRKRGYGPDPVKQELDDLIARAVERAGDPIAGARLRGDVAAVAHTVKEADAAKTAKAFKKQLDGVIKEAVDRSLVAVTKCIQAGEPGLAFDLFKYVLLIDPDNERAHKGLGHVQVSFKGAKTWMRRFDANRLKAGYRWDKTLGWVRYKDQKRYDAGEYYDLQRNQWTTVAEANQHHSDPANFWIIKTEHFELRTSADIAVATRVCERLEAFYLQLFRQYDKFFLGKGAQSTKLIFGMSPSQKAPLVVHFYRSRAQFTQHANPPTDWAAGFYSGGRKASFFYQSGGWTTLQHEIVHQILGETARGGGGAPAWLAEGAAVYLEDAFFKDGSLTLGARENHRRVMTYQYNERSGGQEHKLVDMLKFVTSADWDSGDIAKNYRGAGSVVYFLCHFDNGRYKGDFIEYLKAAYYGGRPKLSDYFGMPESILNDLMRRFYDPKAKLTGGGPASAADLAVAVEAFTKSCKSKTPDLDQLSEAYGLLRKALGGSTSKEAEKTRKKAGKALIAMRKKLAKTIEKEIKGAVSNKGLGARRAKLERLRQKAIAIIEDTTAYPDANHGAAGQHLVDKEVNELKAFWNELPPVFEKPELRPVIEVLEGTAAWLEVLARDIKKRGKTMAELKAELRRRAGPENLILTGDDKKAYDYNQKVRAFNAAQTDIPPEARGQAKVLNDYRIMLGRHALALDTRLYRCAQKHSDWMQSAGNMTHDEPDPARRTPTLRAGIEGYSSPVSENVAFGFNTPEAVHRGWYTSSGHHRNMVAKRAWVIGVAKSGTYWTQVFGWAKPAL